jgi:hypothetical protein
MVSRVPLDKITQRPEVLLEEKLSHEELETITQFIEENKIERAYIGVPSSNSDVPYQIAHSLKIPFTVAYEYMFKSKHRFFDYVDSMASQKNCDFAVPLRPAKDDILAINPAANVYEIGHLTLDQLPPASDTRYIRESLLAGIDDDLVFISGTTQPTEIDNEFLNAILMELSTGKYPTLQLRMGIHPGIQNADIYIQTLLQTCQKYPETSSQFKIIMTSKFEKKLSEPLPPTPFILHADVSGPDAAQAADKIAQSVPGALLNSAALRGGPTYFHEQSVVPYLPKAWFSEKISLFFTAKPQQPHSRKEFGLEDTAANIMSKLMARR